MFKFFSRTPLVGFFGNGEIGVSHLPSASGVTHSLVCQSLNVTYSSSSNFANLYSNCSSWTSYSWSVNCTSLSFTFNGWISGQFLHSFTSVFLLVSTRSCSWDTVWAVPWHVCSSSTLLQCKPCVVSWWTCMRGSLDKIDSWLRVLFSEEVMGERKPPWGFHPPGAQWFLRKTIWFLSASTWKTRSWYCFYRALYTCSLACLALLLYRIFKAPNQPCDLPAKHLERLALLVKEVLPALLPLILNCCVSAGAPGFGESHTDPCTLLWVSSWAGCGL